MTSEANRALLVLLCNHEKLWTFAINMPRGLQRIHLFALVATNGLQLTNLLTALHEEEPE